MKSYHRRQAQFELFPGTSDQPVGKTGPKKFLRKLTFSLENFVVLGIFIVMSMLISFSLGVEKGKKVVFQDNVKGSSEMKTMMTVRSDKNERQVAQAKGFLKEDSVVAAVPKVVEKQPEIRDAGISIESVKNSVKSVLLEARKKKVDSTYTVQVASFRKKVYAEKEAMDLKKKGYEIFVVPKGDYSIVCVGKFAYKNEANQMSRKLRKRYKDCLVRSL